MNSEQLATWCQSSRPKPLVMGILNVTPDSFSDAGCYLDLDAAYLRAQAMIQQGVNILDIGGESSRPGAQPVSTDEELARILPIIERIRASHDVCISVDTCKADVMVAAVASGATFINDIHALQGEGALAAVAAMKVPVCLMHMQGTPVTMQNNPHYDQDIVVEINRFFQARIDACVKSGIRRERLILDPGFGFGKSVQQNLLLLKRLAEFQIHRLPVLLGVSRKSTLGAVLNRAVMDRMPGGIAAAVYAVLHGASIIRTHDVDETTQAMQMIHAIRMA